MATQTGLVKIEGTLGNLIYYKTGKNYLIRRKNNLRKKQLKKDPAFQKSRESTSEFGRASTAGHLLRTALLPLLQMTTDNPVSSRLTRQMLKIIQSDTHNKHGHRNITNGDPRLLLGFNFNCNALWKKS